MNMDIEINIIVLTLNKWENVSTDCKSDLPPMMHCLRYYLSTISYSCSIFHTH